MLDAKVKDLDIRPISEGGIIHIRNLFYSLGPEFLNKFFGFIPTLEDMHRQTIGDPDFDPAMLSGAFKDGELLGGVMGVLRPWKFKETGFVKFLIVRPEVQGHGVGSLLLRVCEAELKARKCKKLIFASSSPYYFSPGAPDDDKSTCGFLLGCGWERLSDRISLNANLENIEPDVVHLDELQSAMPDVSLEIAGEKIRNKLLRFVYDEFSESWAAQTERAFEGEEQSYCSVVIDKKSDKILGFATVNTANPNWFGPMGVRADARKNGLGSMLVMHALQHAKERGVKRLIFPWINEKEAFYKSIIGDAERVVFGKFEKNF